MYLEVGGLLLHGHRVVEAAPKRAIALVAREARCDQRGGKAQEGEPVSPAATCALSRGSYGGTHVAQRLTLSSIALMMSSSLRKARGCEMRWQGIAGEERRGGAAPLKLGHRGPSPSPRPNG
jgi:hypothetical protein